MSFNKENTNPKTLQAIQDNSPSSQSTYGCTPGAVGLRGWQPPQAHMFVSTSAGSGFSAVSSSQPTETHPKTIIAHGTDFTGAPSLRRKNTVTSSPLKVRKTRENLRQGYTEDTNRPPPTPKLTNRKDAKIRASLETVTDARPSREQTIPNGFSLELDNAVDISQPVQPALRKRSVRKMMVSRVKDGLLGRSRSASKMPAGVQLDAAVSCTSSEYTVADYNVDSESFQPLREDAACASRSSTFHSVQELISQKFCEEPSPVMQPKKPAALICDIRAIPAGSMESVPDVLQSAPDSSSQSPEKMPRPERTRTRFEEDSDRQSIDSRLLHIRLSVTPAWNALDLADDSTMWAMIQAKATIATKPDLNDPTDPDLGLLLSLDAVIIIDNSPFASPAALKSMSGIVQQICSLLKCHQDRLAAFCTYCPHEFIQAGTTSGCQIHRLQMPDTKSLMLELGSLEAGPPTKFSAVTDMKEMLQEAILLVTAVNGVTRSGHKNSTHMFVLSPLPRTCTDILRALIDWPIHQIRVGCCHQDTAPPVHRHTDGWSIEWNTAISPTLNEMMCQARTISCYGILSHVKVSINSTSPCRVEKLLTPPRKSTLQLGQCITLFAKVKIPSIGSENKAHVNTSDELFNDLTKSLGDFKSELFKAEVHYRHSLLPKDTHIRTDTACVIQRTNRNSIWSGPDQAGSQNGLELEIEKAYFIANNYNPNQAVKILQKKFGNLWLEDSLAGLHGLREEMEFQVKVLADNKGTESRAADAEKDGIKTPNPSVNHERRTTLHLCDTMPSQLFNFTDNPVPRVQRSTSTQDEARKIWRHMRRNSRTNALLSSSEPSSRNASETIRHRGSQESVIERLADGDGRLRELRLQALRNKRSVGAETLREFGEMQRRAEREDGEGEMEEWV